MVESIKQHGVLIPGIARMRSQGGYEIIVRNRQKSSARVEVSPVMM